MSAGGASGTLDTMGERWAVIEQVSPPTGYLDTWREDGEEPLPDGFRVVRGGLASRSRADRVMRRMERVALLGADESEYDSD